MVPDRRQKKDGIRKKEWWTTASVVETTRVRRKERIEVRVRKGEADDTLYPHTEREGDMVEEKRCGGTAQARTGHYKRGVARRKLSRECAATAIRQERQASVSPVPGEPSGFEPFRAPWSKGGSKGMAKLSAIRNLSCTVPWRQERRLLQRGEGGRGPEEGTSSVRLHDSKTRCREGEGESACRGDMSESSDKRHGKKERGCDL
ncbi:hypothetical protein VTI74DRAFT_5290 [Chaetomium olivicolor]